MQSPPTSPSPLLPEAAPAAADLDAALARRRDARRGTWIKAGLSAVVIGGVLTFMVSSSLSESMEFFHPADVVIVKGAELVGQRMRMGGHVVKASIFHKPDSLEYQFDVTPIPGMVKHPEALGKSIAVHYAGVVPDTFKDDAEVIVTGKLGANGVFEATDLLAKCPSKYEAAQKNASKTAGAY